jgi:hypothetical protein
MSRPVYTLFVPKKFRPETEKTISMADAIIEEYAQQGYDLTLRQLYYQFVSRGLIENSQKAYNSLGATVSDARLAGKLPWNRITDRTRNVKGGGGWESPQSIIQAVHNQYHINLWDTQPNYVEVWVEKEALANVVERACEDLNTPWFCCRGYVSQSEMYAAAQRLENGMAGGRIAHIIHLGDHDPSGIDMTRDIEERLNMFLTGANDWREVCEPDDESLIRMHRIALNMRQVREYNPPPNPAKTTDARFASYEHEFGDKSWELDALEPRVLENLIDAQVRDLIEPDAWEIAETRQQAEKDSLASAAARWEDVQAFLAGMA